MKENEAKYKETAKIALSPLGSDWAEQISKGVKTQAEDEKNKIKALLKQKQISN